MSKITHEEFLATLRTLLDVDAILEYEPVWGYKYDDFPYLKTPRGYYGVRPERRVDYEDRYNKSPLIGSPEGEYVYMLLYATYLTYSPGGTGSSWHIEAWYGSEKGARAAAERRARKETIAARLADRLAEEANKLLDDGLFPGKISTEVS